MFWGMIITNMPELIGGVVYTCVVFWAGYRYGRWREYKHPRVI